MKNIILLITDTFRYDNLKDRAKKPVRTPCLDKFADERATEIMKFITGSFPTVPHRTDVISSVVGWLRYGWQPLYKENSDRWPVVLRNQGYISQLICDCPHLFPTGFPAFFDAAFQHRGQENDRPLLHLNDPIEQVVPANKARNFPQDQGWISDCKTLANLHRWTNHYFQYETDTFCHKTAETTIRWLEENYKAGPFFLWADFFDPHEPWDPPEYLVKKYDPDYNGIPMLHCNYGPATAYTPEELNNLWAHYAAESELVDRSLGRVLQKIDDLQLWDNTIVVVTSDHGTSLGEHNRTGKTNICAEDDRFWPIYPEIHHVPFLIAGSGIPAGKKLDLMAQPVDIFPTVSELAGIKLELNLEGKSFANNILTGEHKHRDFAVSSPFLSVSSETRDTDFKKKTIPFITDGEWGYTPVGPDGQAELYNLTKDQMAENNIISDNQSKASDLAEKFIDYLEQYKVSEEMIKFWKRKTRK